MASWQMSHLHNGRLSSKRKQQPNRPPKDRRFQRDMSTERQDFRFEVGRPEEGMRLDSFLDRRISWRTRPEIQDLIRADRIQIASSPARGAQRTRPATRLRKGAPSLPPPSLSLPPTPSFSSRW